MAAGSNPIDDFWASQGGSGGTTPAMTAAPSAAPPARSSGNAIDNFWASQGGSSAPSSSTTADGTPLNATTPFPNLPAGLGRVGGAPGGTRGYQPQAQSASVGVPANSPAVGGIAGWFDRLGSGALAAAKSAPAGLAHLGMDVIKTPGLLPGALEMLTGNHNQPVTTQLTRTFPGASDLIQPGVSTTRAGIGAAQDVGLAPGTGFEPQFHQDFVAHPFTGILNAALTAATVGAPLASGLDRLARALPEDSLAARTAAGAATGARVGGTVAGHIANAPILPYQLAAHGLSPGLAAAFEHVPVGRADEFGVRPTLAGWADARHQTFLNRDAAANIDIRGKIGQRVGRGEVAGAGLAAAKAVTSPAEFGAAVASLRNETGLFGPALDAALKSGDLTPAEHASLIGDTFAGQVGVKASQQVSAESALLAEQLRRGTLPADQAARIQTAADIIRSQMAEPRQATELSGANRLPQQHAYAPPTTTALNPEQLRFTPLTKVIEDKTGAQFTAAEKAATKATQAEQAASEARARRGGSRSGLDVAAGQARGAADALMRAAEKSKALWSDTPEAAAKRLRPAMVRAQDVADHLRIMSEAASSAGDHATGSRLLNLAESIPTKLSEVAAAHEAGTFADPTHLISERTGVKGPYTGAGRAPLTGTGTVGAARQSAPENLLVGTTPQQLTVTEMARRAEAERNANVREAVFGSDTSPGHGKTAEQILGPEAAGLRGQALVSAMRDSPHGPFEPFDPARSFTDGRITNAAQVGPNTVFMPKGLLDALGRREAPPVGGKLGAAIDTAQRWTYKKWLQYTPKMAVLYAVQDAFAAKANTDMGLIEMGSKFRQAAKEMRDRTYFARAARDTGLFQDEASNAGIAKSGIRGKIAGGALGVRRITSWVDTASKITVMLHEAEKGASAEDAAVAGVKLMGDWGNLGPLERGLIARAVPIYPFIKQVGLAVARFGDNHPLQLAFLAHLGDMAARDPRMANLPARNQGDIPLGGNRYLNASGLFPPTLLSSFTAPEGFVSPPLKFALQAGLGLNLNRHSGSWNMTQPGGTYARPQTGGVQNLNQAEYLALKNNPLGKLYLSQFAPQVARYDTGEPILGKKGPTVYPTDNSLPGRLLSILGLPIDETSTPKNPAKTAKALTKAQQRYAQLRQQYQDQTNIPGLP